MTTINFPKELELISSGVELKDNGADAKTAPITMLARTKQKVSYPLFGGEMIYIVHDFEGMSHKNRIPIDWAHDANEVIGYINRFTIDERGLTLSGALTPFGEDRGTEVISKYRRGVPYQASIMTSAVHEDDIEVVNEGEFAQVNGGRVEGPVFIIRNWELTGVAVVRHGADDATSVLMSKNRKSQEGIEGTFLQLNIQNQIKGEIPMENEKVEVEETVDAENVELAANEDVQEKVEAEEAVETIDDNQAVEAEAEVVAEEAETEEADAEAEEEKAEPEKEESDVEDAVEPGVEAETEEVEVEAEVAQPVAMTGEDFMNTFGETKGAVYYAKSMTIDEAYKAHIEYLSKELEETKAQLSEAESKVQMSRGNDAVELSSQPQEVGMSIEQFVKANNQKH